MLVPLIWSGIHAFITIENLVSSRNVGSEVNLKIRRGTEEKMVTVTVVTAIPELEAAFADAASAEK
jgi:hypothetical protein